MAGQGTAGGDVDGHGATQQAGEEHRAQWRGARPGVEQSQDEFQHTQSEELGGRSSDFGGGMGGYLHSQQLRRYGRQNHESYQ